MAGAVIIGRFLDSTRYGSVQSRALIALSVLFVYVNLTWYWALFVSGHGSVNSSTGVRSPRLDFKERAAVSPFLLYFAWGFVDLAISSWNYWVLGQLTDDLTQLGRLVGVYKCMQSVGAAVAWGLGGQRPVVQLGLNWCIFCVAIACAWIVATRHLPSGPSGPSLVGADRKPGTLPCRGSAGAGAGRQCSSGSGPLPGRQPIAEELASTFGSYGSGVDDGGGGSSNGSSGCKSDGSSGSVAARDECSSNHASDNCSSNASLRDVPLPTLETGVGAPLLSPRKGAWGRRSTYGLDDD
jgi:hypothetical protein